MSCAPTERSPVGIVGGGVVGVTLALMLSNRGIASTVLERQAGPDELPRAHAVNPRTLEILDELGIRYAELQSVAAPRELTREARFVTSLTGYCFGSVPYERQDDAVLELTTRPLLNIPQPALERLLFDRAAADPRIDFRRGHTWVGATQNRDGVVESSIRAEREYRFTSRYLVAADGAGSAVRQSLEIAMSATAKPSAALSVTFAADLTEFVRDRPGALHWVFGTDPGVFVCYYPDSLWGYSPHVPPGRVDMDHYTKDRVREMVRGALGPAAERVPIDIIAVKPWTMRCEVAEQYRSGNVFLCGDAAHRFPPTGGLGLNTGMQDAHNLAWKLAATQGNWGSDGLLDSYHQERRPIALRNAAQSFRNAKAMSALRVLEEPANLHSEAAIDTWLGEGDRAVRVGEAVRAQRDHFDSLALQLDFSYDTAAPPITEPGHCNPKARPGRRLPHGWLSRAGARISTHDLLDPFGFTVVRVRSGQQAVNVSPPGMTAVPITTVWLDSTDSTVNTWLRSAGLSDSVDIVVRPDGHILSVFHGVRTETQEIESRIGEFVGWAEV